MMRCFVFLLIICYLKTCTTTNLNLNRYLDEKFKLLEDTFCQKTQKLRRRDSNNIIIANHKEITIPETSDYISMFISSNKKQILTSKKIYELMDNSLNSTFSNQKSKLHPEHKYNKNIIFHKSITYKNTGYIIFKSKGTEEAHIYQFNNDKFSLVQGILVPNASDGHFFTRNNNLYLVITNNKGDNLAETSIYKWLGFHFNEIQTVFTTGAIKVGSFTARTAEIIVILQDISNIALPSPVFEFNNDEISKIQRIRSNRPINLERYRIKDKNYIVIYTQTGTNTIYGWNDFQLIYLNTFQTKYPVYYSEIIELNNTLALALPFNNKLQLYRLDQENVKLEDEIAYSSNFTSILDIHAANNIYIIGLNEHNNVKINIISMIFRFKNIESNAPEVLRNCFKALDIKLDHVLRNLNGTKSKLFGNFQNKPEVILSESLVKATSIGAKITDLKQRVTNLLLNESNYIVADATKLIINGILTINGRLDVDTLTANDINIKEINGKKWTPEQWLRYEEPQTITGLSKIKTITADQVETYVTDPIFKDLLLKNQSAIINGSMSIEELVADNIYAKNINGVPMDDVYFKSKPEPIKGTKTFKFINCEGANITSINKKSPEVILSSVLTLPNLDFNLNFTVENLEVESINGVLWEEWKNSVFRINISKEIKGPMTFAKIKTKHLDVKKIKDIDVNNILTTSTDQVIEANMEFNNIFTKELKVNTINGVRFPEDVVFTDKTTRIKGPVKFDRIKVLQNLTLTGKTDESFFVKYAGHIMGTNESDFLQIYSGRVTIDGNLHISNLKLLPRSKSFVSGKEITPNLTDLYWTKTTHQKIPVHVSFLQGLSAPHVLTDVINSVRFQQYLVNNNEDKLETNFIFENVSVNGNVLLTNTKQHNPNLNKILKEAVQTEGSYTIHGSTIYSDTLKAEKLQTPQLEGINVSCALNKKWPQNITGTKIVRRIIVKNIDVPIIDNINIINNVSVEDFVENIFFIDKSVNITHLDFKNISAIHLYLETINNDTIEDYIPLQENIKNFTELNNLTIKGSISIDHIKNMSFFNDISYKNLLRNAPAIGELGIVDEVEFTGKMTVKNFIAVEVNDIDLKNLTQRMLSRNTQQIIKSPFTFNNLKTENIITPKVNSVSLENIIDVHSTLPQNIFAPNGITLSSPATVMKNLISTNTLPCSLDDIITELADPPTQKWTQMDITGNVVVLGNDCLLYRVFEKSIKLNSRNIIHSDVNISTHAMMKNLHTYNHINNINIPYILEDAVLSQADTEQVITGQKWFTTIQTKAASVRNANVTFVNGENVTVLNEEIVDKNGDEVIKGKKIFYSGLQTDKFNSKVVLSVKSEDIVNLDQLKVIPHAIVDTMKVNENLNIKFYRERYFLEFLEKRLLIDGLETQNATGIYMFEYLEADNYKTSIINSIPIEDIVFDIGTQNISSKKYFLHPVTINGNVSIDYINGVNIAKEFDKSIHLEGLVTIPGNIIILKPSTVNGSINTEFINNFPVAVLKEILSFNSSQVESEEIYHLQDYLTEKINNTLQITEKMPNDFLYLEKSNALQIDVPNAVSASSITSNGYVLIHVNGYEPGALCGLPINCKCPVQYAIEISPQYSVTMFLNKGFQRIFSYDDDFMLLNFMTNSVSTSSNCRTNSSKLLNEVSMLTWNTKTHGNTTGQFYQYDKYLVGYISKVDFFTLHGNTYAVIGRYYDPVINTHELDCIVIKFQGHKREGTEIQRIHTRGVQEVHILSTAQGIILILCNRVPSDFRHDQEETQIFRFDPKLDKFVRLLIIPLFGCSAATGVVQNTDSLIVLAHEEAPLQVLKYYPKFDNYYFYESFEFEDAIVGISTFYIGDFSISDAYLCLVTSNERYYIYSYQFLEGLKLKSAGELEGLRNLIPLQLNSQTYLFAPSANHSSLLTVIKNGSN